MKTYQVETEVLLMLTDSTMYHMTFQLESITPEKSMPFIPCMNEYLTICRVLCWVPGIYMQRLIKTQYDFSVGHVMSLWNDWKVKSQAMLSHLLKWQGPQRSSDLPNTYSPFTRCPQMFTSKTKSFPLISNTLPPPTQIPPWDHWVLASYFFSLYQA